MAYRPANETSKRDDESIGRTTHRRWKTAIVGGGAAGFFCAINLGAMCHDMEITIFEQGHKVLRKVEVSGGGRCNCTNTFRDVTDLSQVYPRGSRLMKRLFRKFGPHDAYKWFEDHGVPLTVQDDQCVFPEAQDSHAIISCFLNEAHKLGIKIQINTKISDPSALFTDFDYVVVTTGGQPHEGVPSLFSFSIDDNELHNLMGIVVEHAIASIPSTKFRASGPLLITHWGMSGPVILKLSSYAARHLADSGYKSPLAVSWIGTVNADDTRTRLVQQLDTNSGRMITNLHPYALQAKLWEYLVTKANLKTRRCNEIGKKQINRLVELLTNDTFTITGRGPYKDEFVTCGGIPLDSIEQDTLESRNTPHLYYAGEVLDIDGITGGFNFQAAWTTAWTVASGIAKTDRH